MHDNQVFSTPQLTKAFWKINLLLQNFYTKKNPSADIAGRIFYCILYTFHKTSLCRKSIWMNIARY